MDRMEMKNEVLEIVMERIRRTDADIEATESVGEKCLLMREMDGLARTVINALWDEEKAR